MDEKVSLNVIKNMLVDDFKERMANIQGYLYERDNHMLDIITRSFVIEIEQCSSFTSLDAICNRIYGITLMEWLDEQQ